MSRSMYYDLRKSVIVNLRKKRILQQFQKIELTK